MDRDCLERMRTGVQHAGLLIDGFQCAERGRYPFGQSIKWTMQRHSSRIRIGNVRDGFGDECCEAAFGLLAWLEAQGSLELSLNPIDAEGAPIVAGEIPSGQIPAITGVYQSMRLNRARAGRSGAVVVSEAHSVVVAAGVG